MGMSLRSDLIYSEESRRDQHPVKSSDKDQLNKKKNPRNLVPLKSQGKSYQEVMANSATCW